ncbi:MAG TPA: zf-HC2 domain-containing protein [Chthonomonadales bacterium]|nr:zf-HC2 domain-containing protein [Chthonomonadales bacterium]
MLPAYVEGELPPALRERVGAHVAGCARCRASERAYSLALGALGAAPRFEAPADLRAGFRALLRDRVARDAARVSALRWAGAAACLLLVGVAGTHMVVGGGSTGAGRAPASQVAVSAPAGAPVGPAPHATDAGSLSRDAGSLTRALGPASQRGSASAQVADSRQSVPQATGPSAGPGSPDAPAQRRIATQTPASQQSGPVGFLDVRDASGRSARDLIRLAGARTVAPEPAEHQTVPADAESAVGPPPPARRAVLVAEILDERVQVGAATIRLTGERGVDANGRLALLRVRAEAEPTPDSPESP